jgi:CDP-diacylglycerol--glycerol-3-phosphate 3-phosphatidyltransferase
MLIGISTDWFDGQVARWTNTVSEMGKILDPLADKVCALSVAAYFLWINELPVWFVSIVIMRDIAIFFGGIFLKRRYRILTTALPTGKWAVGFMSIVFLAIVWPVYFEALDTIKLAFLWLSTVLLVLSFLQYVWRMIHIIQGKPFKNL